MGAEIDATADPPDPAELADDELLDGEQVVVDENGAVTAAPNDDAIVRWLKGNGRGTAREIARSLVRNVGEVRQRIGELERRGDIQAVCPSDPSAWEVAPRRLSAEVAADVPAVASVDAARAAVDSMRVVDVPADAARRVGNAVLAAHKTDTAAVMARTASAIADDDDEHDRSVSVGDDALDAVLEDEVLQPVIREPPVLSTSGRQRGNAIIDWLAAHPDGGTCATIGDAIGRTTKNVGTRMRQLEEEGRVARGGKDHGGRGAPQIVWTLAPALAMTEPEREMSIDTEPNVSADDLERLLMGFCGAQLLADADADDLALVMRTRAVIEHRRAGGGDEW